MIETDRQRRPAPDPRRRLGRHAHVRRYLAEDGTVRAAVQPGVWDGLLTALRRHSIQESLAALAAKEREVLHLAFLDGMTNREIAAILSISRSTVRRRMVLALASLDGQIRRAGDGASALLVLLLGLAVAGGRIATRSAGALRASPAAGVVLTTAAGAVAGAVVFGAIVTNQGPAVGVHAPPAPRVVAGVPVAVHAPESTSSSPTSNSAPTPVLHDNARSAGSPATAAAPSSGVHDPGCDGKPTNAPPVTPVGPRTVHGSGASPVTHPGKGGCGPHGTEPA